MTRDALRLVGAVEAWGKWQVASVKGKCQVASGKWQVASEAQIACNNLP